METQQYMKTKTNQPLPKAVQTIYERHGKDFFKNIGRKGGQNSHKGGFQEGSELAKEAGRKGGLKSRRGFHYQYRYTQLRDFNPDKCEHRKGYGLSNLALGFGITERKYASCKHDALSQKKWHTIHRMDSLPLNVAVPIYIHNEHPYWYVVVCYNGVIYDPLGHYNYLCDLKGVQCWWAEYIDGVRVIKKDKI